MNHVILLQIQKNMTKKEVLTLKMATDVGFLNCCDVTMADGSKLLHLMMLATIRMINVTTMRTVVSLKLQKSNNQQTVMMMLSIIIAALPLWMLLTTNNNSSVATTSAPATTTNK